MRRIIKQTAEKPRAGSAYTFANCQPKYAVVDPAPHQAYTCPQGTLTMPTRHLDDAKVHSPSAKTDTRPPAGACPSPDILIGGTFLGECQRGSQPDIGRASVPQRHDLGALHTHIPLAVASCARNSAPARATGRGCHGALLVPALLRSAEELLVVQVGKASRLCRGPHARPLRPPLGCVCRHAGNFATVGCGGAGGGAGRRGMGAKCAPRSSPRASAGCVLSAG